MQAGHASIYDPAALLHAPRRAPADRFPRRGAARRAPKRPQPAISRREPNPNTSPRSRSASACTACPKRSTSPPGRPATARAGRRSRRRRCGRSAATPRPSRPAILLQLEAEGKLNVNQTVGRWLPQYPAWKNVTIHRLLNMTSGIPGYDSSETMLRDYSSNPRRHFTTPELVRYAYPTTPGAPAATTGYSYSNTNYLLAEMIVEKVTGHSYTDELDRRLLRAGLGLDDTYYEAYAYPPSITNRTTSGYFFNHDPDDAGLAPLLGKDVRDLSVSWMQGAGGIVSTAGGCHALGTRALHRHRPRAQAARRADEPGLAENRQTDSQDDAARSAVDSASASRRSRSRRSGPSGSTRG